MKRLLALCGVVGPVLFTILVIYAGLRQPDYSHLSQPISALGETGAPRAWTQNMNFILTGLLIAAFGVGLGRELGRTTGSILGSGFIVLFAVVGLVGSGLFPADPGGAAITTAGKLHRTNASIGFLSALLGMWFVGARLQQDSCWPGYDRYSRLNTVAAGVMFILFGLAISGAAAPLAIVAGLFQRLFVFTIFSWLVVIAFRLLQLNTMKGQREDE